MLWLKANVFRCRHQDLIVRVLVIDGASLLGLGLIRSLCIVNRLFVVILCNVLLSHLEV